MNETDGFQEPVAETSDTQETQRKADIERRGAERVVSVILRRIEEQLRADNRLSESEVDTVLSYYRGLGPGAIEAALAALSEENASTEDTEDADEDLDPLPES